jgi:4-diphosphocytidyl-2-C-methyl-D-erythritol kinase
MAAALGSDVPFFFKGGTAWVSGRGEKTLAAPFPGDYVVLLVKPPFSSSTPRAFRLLDRYREHRNHKGDSEWIGDFSPEDIEKILSECPENWPFYNDFLTVLPESNVYLGIVEELKKSGAAFAGLSGSGSCCFGIFKDKDEAERAQKTPKIAGNFTKLTFFLAKKSFP